MTEVLDKLFSNTIYMTIIIMVILFVCVGFSFTSPFKNKTINIGFRVLMYAIAFCFMMSLMFLHYGYTTEFKTMAVGNSTICLFEEYETGGEGPSEYVCRLHIIDKITGIRKERFYIGSSAEFLGMRNDTLCYLKNDDVVLFDAINFKEIYIIKKNEWGNISPELGVGMANIRGNQNSDRSLLPLAELNCKNAKTYWFDPFSKLLMDKEPNEIYVPGFSNNTYELTIKYGVNKQVNYLKDEYAGNNNLKRIMPGYDARNLFTVKDSSTYIDPFFLCIDTLKKVFVFGHYTTTDRLDFYIESKDFDFRTKWKKTSTELASDSYNSPKVNVWKYLNGILYFNNGGFVIAMEPETNKIIWTTRL